MKNVLLICISIGILIGIFVSSCRDASLEPLVCYEDDVAPILISHCTNPDCHDAVSHKEGYNFTTYEGVMKAVKKGNPRRSKLYQVISGGGEEKMPPAPDALTNEQIETIKQWITLGALNSSGCGNGQCDTSVYTFSGGVTPLFEQYCYGCHDGHNTYAPYDLSTYTGVMESITDGVLIESIRHDAGFTAMPSNGPKLNAACILVVQKWIDSGTPDN